MPAPRLAPLFQGPLVAKQREVAAPLVDAKQRDRASRVPNYPSIYVSMYLSIYLSIYPSIYRSIYLLIHPSIEIDLQSTEYQSIYQPMIYLSIIR